jgi:hypothetical protein
MLPRYLRLGPPYHPTSPNNFFVVVDQHSALSWIHTRKKLMDGFLRGRSVWIDFSRHTFRPHELLRHPSHCSDDWINRNNSLNGHNQQTRTHITRAHSKIRAFTAFVITALPEPIEVLCDPQNSSHDELTMLEYSPRPA